MRVRYVVAALLFLAGCDQPNKANDRDAAVQIEQEDRQEQEADLRDKADSLEARVSELESQVSALNSREKVDEANINTAFENHQNLLEAYRNHLRSLHGMQLTK